MCRYIPETGQKQATLDIFKIFLETPFAFLFASQNFLIEEEIIQGLFLMAHFQKGSASFLYVFWRHRDIPLNSIKIQSKVPEFYLVLVIIIIFKILIQGHA